MNHEDMFRLHLAGAGKYKDNKLIIDKSTSIEFIDGMNEYIVYEHLEGGEVDYATEFSYGKRHGRRTSYRRDGTIFSVCDYTAGKELPGTYAIHSDYGITNYKSN